MMPPATYQKMADIKEMVGGNNMEGNYKEVYFHQYCKTCKNLETPDSEDPCHSCLEEPAVIDSHKPINWKDKSAK